MFFIYWVWQGVSVYGVYLLVANCLIYAYVQNETRTSTKISLKPFSRFAMMIVASTFRDTTVSLAHFIIIVSTSIALPSEKPAENRGISRILQTKNELVLRAVLYVCEMYRLLLHFRDSYLHFLQYGGNLRRGSWRHQICASLIPPLGRFFWPHH